MEQQFTEIAALIAEPVRARVMWTLLDGKAYTASELAAATETSPQNISMHLAKLVKADLLTVEVQGRHRYYTFSRQEVAYAIEAMAGLVPADPSAAKQVSGPPGKPVRRVLPSPEITYCRTCYDHLAGRLGVEITQSLVRQNIIEYAGREFIVTNKGDEWFGVRGIDCTALRVQRRSFARPCLDWTERVHHLSGSLGAALLQMMKSEDWVRSKNHSREIMITGKGSKHLYDTFKIKR